jgi:hypothetical protein
MIIDSHRAVQKTDIESWETKASSDIREDETFCSARAQTTIVANIREVHVT